MSKAKIERRRRRRRLAAQRARREQQEIDITDKGAGPGASKQRPRAVASQTRAAHKDGTAREPPPLPLALGALLCVAFAGNLIIAGVARLARSEVLGAGFVTLGALMALDSYFVFKRRYLAWVIMVVVLAFVTAAFLAAAIVLATPAAALPAILTVAPLALLVLPGTRAEVRR